MSMPAAVLRARDMTIIKEVEFKSNFYIAPDIVVYDGGYYKRVSPDNVHDMVLYDMADVQVLDDNKELSAPIVPGV